MRSRATRLSEQQLFDYGTNFVRNDISTVRGAQLPWPYGGKQREIMIDIDPQRLFAWGLSARDVNDAIGLQNVVLPSGTAKIGQNEYPIVINSSPEALDELGSIPIKTVRGTPIYVRDVASVRDGYAPQTSLVHVGGRKSVLMSVLKQGSASTLDVVARTRALLPETLSRLPKDLKVALLFDQSVFVRAAVEGVVKEASIAAGLTALMLLLFLGSWRSTVIVLVSIPLSILVSIIILSFLGQTLNVMTLGGMSLAVGILVDDATVEIENVHRNLAKKKPIVRAILDGASEIAVPAFVSTLCICIVFVPVVFITGAAKSLFIPLAMAVVFAMLTSYFLSRTLVPTLMRFLMAKEAEKHLHEAHAEAPHSIIGRFFAAFERGFEHLRNSYGKWLAWALHHRVPVICGFLVFVVGSLSLLPLVGRDFFPSVDAGLIKLHVRGTPGTSAASIEESERRFAEIEDAIRTVVPPAEIETMLDNIGVPYSSINLSLSEGVLVSSADGDILIALKETHAPTPPYVRRLRTLLNAKFSDSTFFFLAPDISTQVLNFGLPAPIDIQLVGPIGGENDTLRVAQQIAARLAAVPGAVDVHLAQVPSQPEIRVDVDRTMADQLGLTEHDVASDLLVSLSSSALVSPSFWLDKRGVQYLVAVQTPQYEINSLDALRTTPLSTGGAQPQLLSNVAAVSRTTGAANITHYNVARTFDVQANVDGTDLGSVAAGVTKILKDLKPSFPRGRRGPREGAGREHGIVLQRPRLRADVRRRPRLLLDGRELSVVARPPRHPDGPPRRHCGDFVDALPLAHDRQRTGAHGVDHVRRCRDREQHPRRHVRERPASPRPRRDDGRPRRRHDATSPGAHDGAGHDHRHAPHVARPGRRGRAERAARPRGHRRPPPRDLHDAVLRAGHVQRLAKDPTHPRIGPGARMNPPRDADGVSTSRRDHPTEQANEPQGADDLGFDLPAASSISTGRVVGIGAVAVVVLAGAVGLGWRPPHPAREALEHQTADSAGGLVRVDVVTPKVMSSDRAMALPGSTQALEETIVYSRADGYVKKWYVDIGDKVTDNQLLAELETPELDQQLEQGRAQLAQTQASVVQANANRDFSKSTYTRYKQLTDQGLSPQQDLDQRKSQAAVDEANVVVAQANVSAQEANVRRLVQLKAFAKVTAPFGGTVTARMIEVGSLVTSGNATQLYKIAATDPVRVFVQVPQDVAPGVRPDVPAKVTVREFPGRTFDGKVTRSSNELDPMTRTMITEVRVPNPDGKLIVGMYAQVALTLPSSHRVFEIPATAVMNDAKGIRIIVVDASNKLHVVPVIVERDTGSTFEISSGLTGDERVVKLASVSLTDGEQVDVKQP